ncbi:MULTISPECIES: hypothetical protein [Bacillus]|uniref:hypothetical protein n=1 Tax=Bacillus TaxID=1386 RepID=UPI0003200552|nr:hypothetical protein [Bacillus licheniformis]AKQ71753.1 hypothetical protein MUY_000621 [Bacillus licheniformis WX-02]MCP8974427.1 hypothetical protein [Bacillus licheniformis]
MIIAFEIILLLMMLLSFIGVLGEKQNEKMSGNLTAVCLASMISLVVAFLVL